MKTSKINKNSNKTTTISNLKKLNSQVLAQIPKNNSLSMSLAYVPLTDSFSVFYLFMLTSNVQGCVSNKVLLVDLKLG